MLWPKTFIDAVSTGVEAAATAICAAAAAASSGRTTILG
jgi:hypothetical protein